jgi:hypothetical protein
MHGSILGASMVVMASAFGILGCAASADSVDDDSAGGSGSTIGAGGAGGSGSGWATGGSGGSSGSGASGGSGGLAVGGAGNGDGGVSTGNEILCDGLDNDQNGVIDDVDKGKDGICDCLKIATLGVKGKWGQGDVFANWLATRSDFGAVALGTQDLTAALLDPYDVIIAQDLSKKGVLGTGGYDAPQAAALQTWLSGGGGFMTTAGYEDPYSINNVNKLLSPLGVSYGTEQILQNSGSTVAVAGWIPHPVTDGVSLIGVGSGYPVQGPGTMLASQNGHNVLLAEAVGSGRILMWADEWITYDSEWTANPQYQVELFWLNIIKWLSPDNVCQVPIPPGIE